MRHHLRHHQCAIAASPRASLPRRNVAALEQLLKAFRERKPLAAIVGKGNEVPRLLIEALLSRVAAAHDVIRFEEPSAGPLECMQSIVGSIGFDTEGLDVKDLRQILAMFLAYQKTHRRRTILCVERAHEASGWTLDLLEQHVQQEREKQCGLFVILIGESGLEDLLRQRSVSTLAANADATIRIAPLDLDEARFYIKQYVETNGYGPVSELFEYDAITCMYDASDGVPDTINELIAECLEWSSARPISSTLVKRAAGRVEAVPVRAEPDIRPVTLPTAGRLVARLNGKEIEHRAIDSPRILIGRKRTCDMRLPGQSVSREHAMILRIETGARLVDLGSTNGTFVNGERVENCHLVTAAMIRLGDFEIEFSPAD